MSERGKGSSTETRIFIDLIVITTLFSLEHLILQTLIANCGAKVLNPSMQLELEKILTLSRLYCCFFLTEIKFYLVTYSFVIVY